MGNSLLIRALYEGFDGECTEEFPDYASSTEQLTFLKKHMPYYWGRLGEIIFLAWLDGFSPVDFLQASRAAYEKYQAEQKTAAEKQD